jgi:hypothetical protein
VDDENGRKCPNGWGVFHPLAEFHLLEENKKIVHVLFLALLAGCTSIHQVAKNPDQNRYHHHPENRPDNQTHEFAPLLIHTRLE